MPIEQLEFEKQRWSPADLDRVRFGEGWGENARDVDHLDHPDIRETSLAQYMLREKTWPRPILVLDNAQGLSFEERGLAAGTWSRVTID